MCAFNCITAITTDCPAGVEATADESDYNAPTDPVYFSGGEIYKDIQVTVVNDAATEFRELFCLTITTNPGRQNTTKIYITGNDCK